MRPCGTRGLEPVRALQHLRAAAVGAADAAHLGIPIGSPVMATVRYGYLADAPPGRVHALGLSRRPLRFRRRDAPRLSLKAAPWTRRTLAGRILTPGRLGRRHLALHGPDPGDRARPRARRPVHRPGLRRPARAWRPRRRLHGRRRRGAPHGAVPRHATAPRRCSRPRSPRPPPTCAAPWRHRRGHARSRARVPGCWARTSKARSSAPTRWAPSRRSPSRLIWRCWRSWRPRHPIRVATYAPEIDPDGALLAAFRRLGTRAQIGHTTCSYAQARAALAAGAAGFTHLFNAMSGLHHRACRGRRRCPGAGANRPS